MSKFLKFKRTVVFQESIAEFGERVKLKHSRVGRIERLYEDLEKLRGEELKTIAAGLEYDSVETLLQAEQEFNEFLTKQEVI